MDPQLVYKKLLAYLNSAGPLKAKALCEFLSISQPVFSRMVSKHQDSIIRIGRGPQTLYACHRQGAWGKPEIPVMVLDEKGALSQAATLHPISPQGFYLESQTKIFSNQIYENLPYFFEDLRPSGFLGRLVPRLYPSLKFPQDISHWKDDDCLVYLTHCGWDLIGNYIFGEESENNYLEKRLKRDDVVREFSRGQNYPRVAELVMSQGIPGSSAAGEHPKFLSIVETKKGLRPVMVKFSPPIADKISRRVADLLVCEHIAHKILRKHGKISPQSCLIKGEGRLFLEIERFDRNTSGGRRGIISLYALGLQFAGLSSWSEMAHSLATHKIIDPMSYQAIVWLEVFGKLIGNSDRHPGNISFFCNGEKILGLAPTYDMLPMMYAPQQNQLVTRAFDPELPKSDEKSVWKKALNAAHNFWTQVQKHSMVSKEFKKLTSGNAKKLTSLAR